MKGQSTLDIFQDFVDLDLFQRPVQLQTCLFAIVPNIEPANALPLTSTEAKHMIWASHKCASHVKRNACYWQTNIHICGLLIKRPAYVTYAVTQAALEAFSRTFSFGRECTKGLWCLQTDCYRYYKATDATTGSDSTKAMFPLVSQLVHIQAASFIKRRDTQNSSYDKDSEEGKGRH